MLRVGLTGGLASGKSTVAHSLEGHGIPVLDADLIARKLLDAGTPTYEQVVRVFGAEILSGGAGSSIDRKRLAAIAFDPVNPRVAELNAVVHPAVIEQQELWMEGLARDNPESIAVVEAALIYEAGSDRRFDKMIVVTAPEGQRAKRFSERTGCSEAEARQRIAAQMSDEEKAHRADYVIENSGTIDELLAKADELAVWLRRDAAAHGKTKFP